VEINCEAETKLGPEAPVRIGGGGALRNDSGLDRCLRSAEVSAEVMDGVGVQSCQGRCCG
jgi:hypothetical protein